MGTHTAPGVEFPCTAHAGRCWICDQIDRTSPLYSEHVRRLFFPDEFPPHIHDPDWPTLPDRVPPRPCCGG